MIVIVAGVYLYFSIKREYKAHLTLYTENIVEQLYPCMFSAITQEFISRAYPSDVSHEEWQSLFGNGRDAYEIKTIEVPDTTFQIRIKGNDWAAHIAVKQFIFKDFNPLNLYRLDNLFRREMKSKGIIPKSVNLKYIDIKGNRIMSDYGKIQNNHSTYTLEILPIDIMETVGVKGSVEVATPMFKDALKTDTWLFVPLGLVLLVLICLIIDVKLG